MGISKNMNINNQTIKSQIEILMIIKIAAAIFMIENIIFKFAGFDLIAHLLPINPPATAVITKGMVIARLISPCKA